MAALSLLALAGPMACGPAERPAEAPTPSLPTDWAPPAQFSSVERTAAGVVIGGRAAPGVRIVLVDPQGVAFASSASAQGLFEVQAPSTDAATLYRSEIHTGPTTVLSGDFLVVTPGPGGAAAALRPGGPARLLQGRLPLATADYDGTGLIVSGWAPAGQAVTVHLDDLAPLTVSAGRDGTYAARFPAAAPGLHRLRVAGAWGDSAANLTLSSPQGQELTVQAQDGWTRIDWPLPGGGVQSTWIRGSQAGAAPPPSAD